MVIIINMGRKSKNQLVYELFVKTNNINALQKKYVVFVNGKLEEFGDSEIELVNKTYDKYGNVEMWVGRTDGEKDVCLIDNVEYVGSERL